MSTRTEDLALFPGAQPGRASIARAYVWYVVALIWATLLLRFVDLQIVSVLMEPIKAEFKLTDTQLGLFGGFAFALFYGTLGIPVAWLADRSNRRNLIAAAVGLWSLLTALSGVTSTFLQLFLARIGVGIGEAGGTPPAFSLLSDCVPPAKRATAFALVNSSQPFGVFCGFLVGGWVATHYGWRAAFLVAGVPGILLALAVLFTLREPARGTYEPQSPFVRPRLLAAVSYLWSVKSYRHMVAANALAILGAAGGGVWMSSYFIRVQGLTLQQTAFWLAIIYGTAGTAGAILGGVIADRLSAAGSRSRWYAWVPALAMIGLVPCSIVVFLSPTPGLALGVHVLGVTLLHAWLGPHHATIQGLAGASRRSVATAMNLLVVNLIGMGMGPLLVGMLNDRFTPVWGVAAIRYSILIVIGTAFAWAALHFLLAAKTLPGDLAAAQRPSNRQASSGNDA